MRRHPLRPLRLLLFLALPSTASAQPDISLPPEEQPKPAIPKPSAIALPRESQIEVPLDAPAQSGTAIGGYGEIVLNAPFGEVPPALDGTTADVRRLVLYVGHNFNERLRLYTEIEIEHAVSSASDRGEVEVEQAFVDYVAWRPFNLRAGLIVMPVGIVNVYHEPPTFNGVDRPDTDLRVIPSTWREIGAGAFGAIGPLRYQAYAVTGFAARGFTVEGLRDGHQEGQLARAHDWGVVARVDWTPFAGADVGASFYRCNSSQGDPGIASDVPVTIVEADARLAWRGLHARAELANVWIVGTQALNAVVFPTGNEADGPVARQLRGGYLELGYDLLHPFRLRGNPSLVAFGRYERTDTQAEVLDRAPSPGRDRQAFTVGLTLRPIAEIAVKVDYQRRTADPSSAWNQINVGLGFMY